MEQTTDNFDKASHAIIPIDGTKARKIREGKKLTQLYVANVVGVTTDTISRWENNRYPAIKRDNAEKLAAALEVELTEILRQEEQPPPVEEPPPSPEPRRRGRGRIAATAGAIFALAAVCLILFRPAPKPPLAERKLPSFAAPATVVPVQIKVERRDSAIQGYVVKERLPAGWRLFKASPAPASGQAAAEEIKWLIPGGAGTFTISYTATVSPAAVMGAEAAFTGAVVVSRAERNSTEAVGGGQKLKVGGFHWADRNGDGVIDDTEIMPAYYMTEEMKDFGLDWKIIEAIWSGKGYHWEAARKGFVVVK